MRGLVWMKASTGMPGTSLRPRELCDLALRDCNAHGVVAGAGLLILAHVGRETRLTSPLSSGVVRWLKAVKRRTAGCPTRTWSMSCGCYLRLDLERIGLRHDQHDRFARADHAADRVHGELVDHAVHAARGYRRA